jgi:hypothetical protein
MAQQDGEVALLLALPPEFDQEALAEAVQCLQEIVGTADRVNLTITSEFRDRVRELVEDEDCAANYEQDREHAFTLAKVIHRSDGSIEVVVYAGLFDRARPYGSPLAVFEHEALHVAITLRDESLNDLRIRNAGANLPVPSDIVAMAGVASEEYRVERLLAAAGHEGRTPYGASFEDAARRVHRQIARDVDEYRDHLDIRRLAGGVLGGFHALATYTGYVAGEIAAAGASPKEFGVAEEVDDQILGPAWREVLEALIELPPADQPTARSELDDLAMKVAERLQDWLTAIGFEVREVKGFVNFQVLNPAQWILGPEL